LRTEGYASALLTYLLGLAVLSQAHRYAAAQALSHAVEKSRDFEAVAALAQARHLLAPMIDAVWVVSSQEK
jgi:hypothetical protein